MSENTELLSYPIGRFQIPLEYDENQISKWIDRLEVSPDWYDTAIENMDELQLKTPYQTGGWTVKQGYTSCCGQPYEWLCQIQMGPN